VTGAAATAHGQLLAFHDAFGASILFGVLGIVFAMRIRDQGRRGTMQPNRLPLS